MRQGLTPKANAYATKESNVSEPSPDPGPHARTIDRLWIEPLSITHALKSWKASGTWFCSSNRIQSCACLKKCPNLMCSTSGEVWNTRKANDFELKSKTLSNYPWAPGPTTSLPEKFQEVLNRQSKNNEIFLDLIRHFLCGEDLMCAPIYHPKGMHVNGF